MNSDIENFISQYIVLPQDMISLFNDIITYTELEAFDFLTKTNEYPTYFFIIKTGLIRSYLQTEDGKEITRSFFTSGQLTGNITAMIKKNSLRFKLSSSNKNYWL